MNYGIKKVIKEKKFSNGKIIICELFGYNLFALLVFDKNDYIVDSYCRSASDNSKYNECLSWLRKIYKKKIKEYFNH